jgi:hypothetical protein
LQNEPFWQSKNSRQNGNSALLTANAEQGKESERPLDIVAPHNNIYEQEKVPSEFRGFMSDFCLPGDPMYETAERFIVVDSMVLAPISYTVQTSSASSAAREKQRLYFSSEGLHGQIIDLLGIFIDIKRSQCEDK